MAQATEVLQGARDVRFRIHLSRHRIADASQAFELRKFGVAHAQAGIDAGIGLDLTLTQSEAGRPGDLRASPPQ